MIQLRSKKLAQLCLIAAFAATSNAQTIDPTVTSCPDPEYKFNAMEFKCEKCEDGKEADNANGGKGNGLECVCKPGYINLYDTSLTVDMEGYEIVTGCDQCT